MKIGIISDIHGNLPALSAVLETLDRMSVSGVVCAGDIAGYYPFVNEVIAELMRVDAVAIMGNHDHALVRGTDIPESRSATEAIRFARDRILPGNLEYLASLPAMRELRIGTTNITLFHGTPADPLNGRIRTGEDLSAGASPPRFAAAECCSSILDPAANRGISTSGLPARSWTSTRWKRYFPGFSTISTRSKRRCRNTVSIPGSPGPSTRGSGSDPPVSRRPPNWFGLRK